MSIRFFLLSLFIVFIAGCENQNDQTFPLSSLVEEKKPIGTIDIEDDRTNTNANEEAKTSRQKKIDEFESIITHIKLKRVKKNKINDLSREYISEDKLLSVVMINSKNRKDVLFIDITSDGNGLVVSIEDGESIDKMYEIINGDSNLYEEVNDFYKSIYKEITL
ncbi:hypothetical protein [Halobacillus trueperi]|uniref:hypothetical protein n=1 Tax=Halobacillus trueperi TaxID=156205 RepID=UPI003736B643